MGLSTRLWALLRCHFGCKLNPAVLRDIADSSSVVPSNILTSQSGWNNSHVILLLAAYIDTSSSSSSSSAFPSYISGLTIFG